MHHSVLWMVKHASFCTKNVKHASFCTLNVNTCIVYSLLYFGRIFVFSRPFFEFLITFFLLIIYKVWFRKVKWTKKRFIFIHKCLNAVKFKSTDTCPNNSLSTSYSSGWYWKPLLDQSYSEQKWIPLPYLL